MALDYFVLVFIAAIGVYQIASIPAGLRGLWFFRQHKVQYFFGILAILGVFGWFYTSEERNIQHTVEGAQQLWLFLGAIVFAYFINAILASVIQAAVSKRGDSPIRGKQQDRGMETLKTMTLLDGILSSWRKKKGIED